MPGVESYHSRQTRQTKGDEMKSKYEFISRDGYETEILVERDINGREIACIRIQGMKRGTK